MKGFKQFTEEMTATGAVAGAGDDSETVPVYLGKKKKKRDNRPDVLKRFISKQEESRKYWSK
jgi:hypothetical protein|tara:strand:- start:149 stop:334 length:186 start_codon:yes stop_codon:yes gene_type:complete